MATKKVDAEVLGVLRAVRVEDSRLFIDQQLERKLYERVNEVLELMGGKWKRGRPGYHAFEWDPKDQIADILACGEIVDWKKTTQFYATPAHIAANLVERADLAGVPELRILEPSAGRGAIAQAIYEAMHPSSSLYLIEKDPTNRGYLLEWSARLRGKDVAYRHVPDADFLQHTDPDGYDRIVGNPPFAKRQDAKHVLHMWELLAPGGILVSVMSAGAECRSDREYVQVRKLLETHHGWMARLPDKAFHESGTDVCTVMIRIQKPGQRVRMALQAAPVETVSAPLSPLFQQYWSIKREYPDVLLMFRLGDFYEMFGEDAQTAARVLEITCTRREYVKGEKIPMCGVPHHCVDRYVARLIAAGYRVALCEQTDEEIRANPASVVRRLLTPGQPSVELPAVTRAVYRPGDRAGAETPGGAETPIYTINGRGQGTLLL